MSDIQSSMRKTLALLETVESGNGSYLLEGAVKQVDADLRDLSDTEFLKHYKKTKAEVRKEFSSDEKSEKETVKEGIPNSDEDPNLHKAYMMGARAYKAYKNNPEQAQRVQDEIEAKFPQYLKMWTRGYNDSERFDKQEAIKEETSSTYSIEERPCPVCKEKELTYNQGADHLSCGGCGTGFSRATNGKWRKENTAAKKSFADIMGGSAADLTRGLSIKESGLKKKR